MQKRGYKSITTQDKQWFNTIHYPKCLELEPFQFGMQNNSVNLMQYAYKIKFKQRN